MENNNAKLLTTIYQISKTAIQSMDEILYQINCENLIKEISSQQLEFQVIAKECLMISSSENANIKDNNWFEKAKIWTSIKFSTFSDNSSQHMAEMLIIGNMMGMIDIIRDLSLYKKADIEILELGKKLLDTQENNVEKLKPFLQVTNK